jgi:hypothetical protein
MSERNTDRADLAEALRIIRERFPHAVAVDLETTDQDTIGFVLRDVILPEGKRLETTDVKALDSLADKVWPLLSSLGWDGVVGEDRHGYATVPMMGLPAV